MVSASGAEVEKDADVSFSGGKLTLVYGNQYNGAYKLDGSSVTFSDLKCHGTQNECHLTPAADTVAQAFLTATKWNVEGNTLRLLNESKNILLELKH